MDTDFTDKNEGFHGFLPQFHSASRHEVHTKIANGWSWDAFREIREKIREIRGNPCSGRVHDASSDCPAHPRRALPYFRTASSAARSLASTAGSVSLWQANDITVVLKVSTGLI